MDAKTEATSPVQDYAIKSQGVHHGAYITNDMDATVKFYTGILNMPLVVTLALPSPDPFGGEIQQWGDLGGTRHYFFDCGGGDRIAFFSWNESFGSYNPEQGVFHHLAFNVATEAELEAAKRKLEAHGIGVSKVIDHFFCKSIYFKDPNGIHLEFATSTLPMTVEQPFLEDPEPVPAAREVLGDQVEKYGVSFREGHDFVAKGGSKT